MAQPSVKVTGLKELHRAFKGYDDELKRELDTALKEAGEMAASGARARFSMIDARSAAGFKVKLAGFGRVVVQQTRRKTTGKRPGFGALQMQEALIPARGEAFPKVVSHLEQVLDTLGRKEGF